MKKYEVEALKNEYESEDIDSYEIYQLKRSKEEKYLFEPLERLTAHGLKVERKNYTPVYIASLGEISTPLSDIANIIHLEKIYERFNFNHPEDYKAHSLSISDIVVLRIHGQEHAYYTDRIGFKEVPVFLGENATESGKRDSQMG